MVLDKRTRNKPSRKTSEGVVYPTPTCYKKQQYITSSPRGSSRVCWRSSASEEEGDLGCGVLSYNFPRQHLANKSNDTVRQTSLPLFHTLKAGLRLMTWMGILISTDHHEKKLSTAATYIVLLPVPLVQNAQFRAGRCKRVVRSHLTVPARALPALHRTMYRASPTPRAKTPDARGASGIDRQGRENTNSTQTVG